MRGERVQSHGRIEPNPYIEPDQSINCDVTLGVLEGSQRVGERVCQRGCARGYVRGLVRRAC